MSIYIWIAPDASAIASFTQKVQGALRLVDYFLQALKLRPLLGQQIKPPHYVDALVLLVKSIRV
jgi:hypothetical protein